MDDLLPGPGLQIRVSFFPNGHYIRVIEPVNSEAWVRRRNASCGFGGVPASGKAVAGLKRQKHCGDDDDAVSGWRQQAKRRRRQRGTGTGDETTTDEEAAAAAACAICLEDFEDGDGLAVMPCAHRFHDGCLTHWLALSRLCPCCRHALPSEDDGKAEIAGANQEGAREAATTRSRRVRQANVRLFGPEWAADTSDDGLGLQQH